MNVQFWVSAIRQGQPGKGVLGGILILALAASALAGCQQAQATVGPTETPVLPTATPTPIPPTPTPIPEPEYPTHAPLDAEARDQWAFYTRYPHNIFLALWIESGLLGLLFFLLVLVAAVAACARGLRLRQAPEDGTMLRACLAGLLATLLHGALSVAPHYPSVLLNASVALAFLV